MCGVLAGSTHTVAANASFRLVSPNIYMYSGGTCPDITRCKQLASIIAPKRAEEAGELIGGVCDSLCQGQAILHLLFPVNCVRTL
jgi:hypothetical protein